MNNAKIVFLTMFIITSFVLLVSCIKNSESMWSDAKIVKEIPIGFVYLPKNGGNWGNGLHYVPWETQISFLDIDDNCIYQTGFDNSDFIVKYGKEYYINEENFLELMAVANATFEQHNIKNKQ
ncbi:MAG: hypothetical protein FWH05_05765 [Oscillospiraceae bacterium]|nr:hypothetical protein [Oscillospiraceae bacterium]